MFKAPSLTEGKDCSHSHLSGGPGPHHPAIKSLRSHLLHVFQAKTTLLWVMTAQRPTACSQAVSKGVLRELGGEAA